MDSAPLLDPKAYYQRRLDALKPAFEWNAATREEAAAWQRRVREKVRELVGLPCEETGPASGGAGSRSACRTDLQPRITGTKAFSGYRRETVIFRSRAGLDAFAYFLLPERMEGRRPAVLCLPGHGRGVDSIVGMGEDGSQRPLDAPGEYQKDFALQCVKHGYPTLALEQISFGHRRDEEARKAGGGTSSCGRDTTAAFMLGETMTGWRVWDAIRALDYLQSRPEVDPERLVTMGISGGGLTSLWTAALDERVTAAVVSGYFNTFRDSILAMNHCVDNYVPGVSQALEMPDLAGLVAPRALFVEGGTRDPIFPLPATKRALRRAEEIYRTFGAEERFGSEIFEGEHEFHGAGAFKFLDSHL
ncbi:MAG: alpha/beta hydrolase family protein [Armatimonadetes bacterium]|nr:alpha/beta hydrolase family protein [Armatimonadota bacterium]